MRTGTGSKGNESEVEVDAEFVGRGVGDAAEDGVAVHLGEKPDESGAKEDEKKGEAPVDKLVGLEGVGVPRDDGEHEGRRDEEHEVVDVHQHGTYERYVTEDEKFFSQTDVEWVLGCVWVRFRVLAAWIVRIVLDETDTLRVPVGDEQVRE